MFSAKLKWSCITILAVASAARIREREHLEAGSACSDIISLAAPRERVSKRDECKCPIGQEVKGTNDACKAYKGSRYFKNTLSPKAGCTCEVTTSGKKAKVPLPIKKRQPPREMDPAHKIPVMLKEDPEIDIYVRCSGLKGTDWVTATDPRARVQYDYVGLGGQLLTQIEKTEALSNNANPQFATPLKVKHSNDQDPLLQFYVYEVDYGNDTFLTGGFTATLSSLVKQGSGGKTIKPFLLCSQGESVEMDNVSASDAAVGCKEDTNAGHYGTCKLSGFDTWLGRSSMELQLFAMDLANTDWAKNWKNAFSIKAHQEAAIRGEVLNFGTDPYVQIYASRSVEAPCILKNASQIQWSKRKPTGVLDENCIGPISIYGPNLRRHAAVLGRSTEAKNNMRKGSWDKFRVSIDELCGGNWERMITIAVFDDDKQAESTTLIGKYKRDDFVGAVSVPASALRDVNSLLKIGNLTGGTVNYDVKELALGAGSSRGLLMLNSSKQIEKITAAQFTESHVDVKLTFAVDFSQSNLMQPYGNLSEILKGGLHKISPDGERNPYERVLKGVADVVGGYDTDGKLDLWTFGGLRPTDGKAVDVVETGEWEGAEKLINGYRQQVELCMNGTFPEFKVPQGWGPGEFVKWCFSGPSNYGKLVDKAAEIARADMATQTEKARKSRRRKKNSSYHVLIIVTDGDDSPLLGLKDSLDLKVALKNSVDAPLSVVIVSVGNGRPDNFKHLRRLDNDLCQEFPSLKRDNVDLVFVKDIEAKWYIEQRSQRINEEQFRIDQRHNARRWLQKKAGFGKKFRAKVLLSVEEQLARQVADELPAHVLSHYVETHRLLPRSIMSDFFSGKVLSKVMEGTDATVSLADMQKNLGGADLPGEALAQITPEDSQPCGQHATQQSTTHHLNVCIVGNCWGMDNSGPLTSAFPEGKLPGQLKWALHPHAPTPTSKYSATDPDRKQYVYPCGGSLPPEKWGVSRCMFPFSFDNEVYHDCTSVGHNEPWCRVDGVEGEWGNCNCTIVSKRIRWGPPKAP